jgi:hypothetical protein
LITHQQFNNKYNQRTNYWFYFSISVSTKIVVGVVKTSDACHGIAIMVTFAPIPIGGFQ